MTRRYGGIFGSDAGDYVLLCLRKSPWAYFSDLALQGCDLLFQGFHSRPCFLGRRAAQLILISGQLLVIELQARVKVCQPHRIGAPKNSREADAPDSQGEYVEYRSAGDQVELIAHVGDEPRPG